MKRMLFNATQQEELRVAIVDGQKLIDIDIETTGREQRKSNIYKGVITRIEPSLEACFVNYGEERHGFLPFKEVARSFFREGADVRTATIKDALREGQEIVVQVEKEERGNKGAALTSFISLAGRYLVLMPNNPRGGGVSRRVEGEDRQELREAMDKLELPSGMSVIARTAGIGRSVDELQWDLNYLMQLWRAIEGAGQSSSGAFLIYQESSLVIRAIRDYFQPDIGEILIDTDDIYEQAQQFMSHVMPDMVHRVKRYRDDAPLFSRFQIEHQIETAYSRTVPLPSGGAIVIDHTEALVSIDVNSARATRGSDIETTALNTNLEAADEVARQLRLRDLGGLIVIDFIDMENAKNQREVETRLKDALRFDRARVQMGKISRFGLMELSRQRLRPSLSEGSHVTCPRCNGTGHIRDTESSALQVLRIIQEEAMKEHSAAIHVQAPVDVAAFLLNEKRGEVLKIETRHRVSVVLIPNKHLETPHYKLERIKHDDPRLEEAQASYDMAEEVDTDISYGKRQKEEVRPRQEAVVKGITPEQPAPIVERKPVEPVHVVPAVMAPAEQGFFSRMFGFFRKKPVTPAAVPVPVVEEKAQPSRERSSDRGTRGSQRSRGRGRGGRDKVEDRETPRNEGREEISARKAQNGGTEGQQVPRQSRQQRENPEARREGNEPRRERQQRQREERNEAVSEEPVLRAAPAAAVEITTPPAVELVDTAETSLDTVTGISEEGMGEQGEERRRRRRRGGRNRNRRDRENGEVAAAEVAETAGIAGEVSEADGQATQPGLPEVTEPGAVETMAEVAETIAEIRVTDVAPVQSVPEQVLTEQTPAMVETSTPKASMADTAIPAHDTVITTRTVEAAEVPGSPVTPEAPVTPDEPVIGEHAGIPAETAPVAQVAVSDAEKATPAAIGSEEIPTETAPEPQRPADASPVLQPGPEAHMQVDTLREVLSAAGLTLAVTDPEKMRAAQEAAAKIAPAPRVPRERKPLPPPSPEPLVQVETRR